MPVGVWGNKLTLGAEAPSRIQNDRLLLLSASQHVSWLSVDGG